MQKEAAAGGDCIKGLAQHLKGGNKAFGEARQSSSDFHPQIKQSLNVNDCIYLRIGVKYLN